MRVPSDRRCGQRRAPEMLRGLATTLARVAVATFAVALLLAARLAPFLALESESDAGADGSGAAATQPCC